MLYFPGQTASASKPAAAGGGAALDRALPRASLKGPTPAAARVPMPMDPRMVQTGTIRPGTGGDPAGSPSRRDAANNLHPPGSRGAASPRVRGLRRLGRRRLERLGQALADTLLGA